MKKKGLVGKIVLIIFIVLILIIAGAGIYFYNFHVFKEVRVCIGESVDIRIPCGVSRDCLEIFDISLDELGGAPEFVMETARSVLDRVIYCDGTCFVRDVRGIDFESGELEVGITCEYSEEEVVMEIRGKEGLEILDWMKGLE